MNNRYELAEIVLTEKELKKRVAEFGKQIAEDYKGEPIVAICVLKGAAVFMTDLVRAIDGDVRLDFMAVSSYGASTKSSGVVRILKDLDGPIVGKNLLIVEDIIDSGLTLSYLRENLIARGPKSVRICTLLDKPARRKANITPDYVGFTIPDKFIVGYGLDVAEQFRNLPYIANVIDHGPDVG